jgi:hypothetical protein
MSAESSGGASAYSQGFTASTTTVSNRYPALTQTKNLEDEVGKKVIPPPPLRNAKNLSAPVDSSCKVRCATVNPHAIKSSRVRLPGKVPCGQPEKHRERSVSRSSRRDDRNVSSTSLERKLDKSRPRGRSTSNSLSTSSTHEQRSSSLHSHAVVDHTSSFIKACGLRNSTYQRRHSVEIARSKSACNGKFNRHDSAPLPLVLPLLKQAASTLVKPPLTKVLLTNNP